MKRFESLAATIDDMISDGVLSADEKIPSIREASRRFGVSPSTVFKAYYLLESRGLISARERSGYYVNHFIEDLLSSPSVSAPPSTSSNVNVNELVFSVLDAMREHEFAPFGLAFPAMDFFPYSQLSQSLNRANRSGATPLNESHIGPGNKELRRAIARRYRAAGVKVDTDDIHITNGAMEALNLSLKAVTQPGDVVAIESPGFYAALQMIENLGLRAVEIPMHPQQGMDLTALEKVLTRQKISACWCMTSFQNPLGATMPADKKRQLVKLLSKHNVPLIEDDVYGELYFGKHYPKPAKAYDEHDTVVHCGSFSKSLAPTYRVGWVISKTYYERIRKLKLMTTLSTPLPTQLAVADYLNRGGFDRHLRKFRRELEQQQSLMTKAIADYFPKETKVTRPRGGFFLWVELHESIDSLALYETSIKNGISFAPGPIFTCHNEYKNCIRLNYGQPISKFEPALKKLGKLAKKLMR